MATPPSHAVTPAPFAPSPVGATVIDPWVLRPATSESRAGRMLNQALARHRRGSEAATLHVIARALLLEPTLAEGHFAAAVLSDRMGDERRARAHWSRYLELVPGAADAAAVRNRLRR